MNWYKANRVDIVPKESNSLNCPNLRPIERYWTIVKNKMRRSNRAIQRDEFMVVRWDKIVAQGTRFTVQGLKVSIKENARNFIHANKI